MSILVDVSPTKVNGYPLGKFQAQIKLRGERRSTRPAKKNKNNKQTIYMANTNTKPKRNLSEESESDSEQDQILPFLPIFLVLASLEDAPLLQEEVISCRIIPKSVKNLRNGSLVVEAELKKYIDSLLKMNSNHHIRI